MSSIFPRSSGILLHPTSLPGGQGIGDLGPEAHRFCDFLRDAGQTWWQMLPLGPTGYGDSPYQCFSAFAGNPLLISLEQLAERGWLSRAELGPALSSQPDRVDYAAVAARKFALLEKAAAEFHRNAPAEYAEFLGKHSWWLEDLALFMALKQAHGGVAWTRWDTSARNRTGLTKWKQKLEKQIDAHLFMQFAFFEQFAALKAAARERGIRLIGDLPIYVAHDSADVWAARELFQLDAGGEPRVVAGVPPDYFSETGQRWGNPIYDWQRMKNDGFRWWIKRFRAAFEMFDAVRLDHFRGFEAYWQSPANEATAANGSWVPGPGMELFEKVQEELGPLPVIAENLGVITPGVEAIRERFSFPGMAILQFAFGNDPQAPTFKPHNYPRNVAAYTGTHDNDTAMGWWSAPAGKGSIRTDDDIRRERAYACRYLRTDGREMSWTLIETLMASVADVVVFPMQDVLGLGSDARMNTPATASGNWRWRLDPRLLIPAHAERLRRLVETYDRSVPEQHPR